MTVAIARPRSDVWTSRESSRADEPATSDGFWYLVRAVNTCGVGDFGVDSAGLTRALPPSVYP